MLRSCASNVDGALDFPIQVQSVIMGNKVRGKPICPYKISLEMRARAEQQQASESGRWRQEDCLNRSAFG